MGRGRSGRRRGRPSVLAARCAAGGHAGRVCVVLALLSVSSIGDTHAWMLVANTRQSCV
jgi:hypothetical protein